MTRLRPRVGLSRTLSITVLVAGIAGGVALSDRQDQQRTTVDLQSAQAAGVSLQPAGDVQRVPGQQINQDNAADQQNAQTKADDAAAAAAAQAKAADGAERQSQAANRSQSRTSGGPSGATVSVPSSCAVYSGNRAKGCAVLLERGYGLDQAPCLINLWNRESGWNTAAANPSGAYGIPQAKPGNKMAPYGSDWRTNAVVQIEWGLDYIKGRYKTPCGAWAHSQSTGWY